jgi:hypothetical protein
MFLGVSNERREIGRRHRIRERDAVVVFRDQSDRGEVVELELDVLIDRRVDRFEMRTKEQVVAILRLREHVTRCNHAGRGRLVLDDHAVSECIAELVRNETCRDVGRAAGTETHYQPDRLARIGILRHRR